MSGWRKHKLESRLLEEIYSDDTIPMAESKEVLKCLLRKVKEESEKAGLKLNIQGKRHMYPNVHHSTVYNSQDMDAT